MFKMSGVIKYDAALKSIGFTIQEYLCLYSIFKVFIYHVSCYVAFW